MGNYDFKVVRFPNGSTEIRIYDQPIWELTPNELERRKKKRELTISRRESAFSAQTHCYVPFLDDITPCIDLDEQERLDYLDDLRKKKNARDSYRRTVNKIHDLARCEKWSMFYTLTFSPDVVDRQDFDACMKKARKWFDNLRQQKAPNLKYLCIPELHADGVSWHLHGLVCCDENISYIDSGKRDKSGNVIYNVDSWKYGFSTATRIVDTRKASSYVLKYITKDLCEKSLGRRRYFRSNNIQEPIIEEYLSSDVFNDGYIHDSYNLKTLLDSLGLDSISRKKKFVTEYCSVTYINAD